MIVLFSRARMFQPPLLSIACRTTTRNLSGWMIATSSTTTLLLRGASRSRTKDIHGDHQKHYSSLSLSSSSLLSSSSSLPTRNYSWNHKKTFPFSSDATDSTSPSSTETAAPPAQQPSLSIQLYQYAICPFCNRVKALLDYAGLPYQTIEVNPLTKAEIRPFRASTGYTKVPILTIAAPTQNGSEQDADDEEDVQPITDSAKIVQGLLEMEQVQQQLQTLRWNHNNSTWNLDKFQNGPNTQNMVDLAVNDLAAVLYPNMCGSWSDSYRAFEYVQSVPTFTPIQRILIQTIGSVAMYMAASRVKKKRNITDERQALDEILVKLESELTPSSSSSVYLSGGSHPDLGDITVFGVLRSIERLPIFESLIRQRGGPLVEWYDRMTKEMKPPSPPSS